MNLAPPPYLDAATIARALPPAAAVATVTTALRSGLDPARGVPRSFVPTVHGTLLLMPAETSRHVGVKLATVAPDNPGRGLPRIGAVYALFDAQTLIPVALLDGVALTNLRTPAVSVAGVRPWLDRFDHPLSVVCFGAGPQGVGHLETLAGVHPLARADLVVRQPDRVRAPELGVDVRLLAVGDPAVEEALRGADVVVCATTAREPVFASALLGDRAIVLAVGSHEPDAREVDAAFLARATVVVEDVAHAGRECGDVVLAVAEGVIATDALVPIAAVASGAARVTDGPVLFKGSGMSWEDLVVAEAVLDAASAPTCQS